MVSSYGEVEKRLWSRARQMGWSGDETHLALFLLTGPDSKTEGFYRLTLGAAVEDIGWDLARLEGTLQGLIGHGFCEYDFEAKVVFVRKRLKRKPPAGDKQIAGALRRLREVPPSSLLAGFVEAAFTFAPAFGEALLLEYSHVDRPSEGVSSTAPPEPEYPSEGVSGSGERTAEHPSEGVSPRAGARAQAQALSLETSSSAADAADADGFAEEVIQLSGLFAGLMRANDDKAKVSPGSKAWLDPIRLLLDRDDRELLEVEQVMRWVHADEFERTVVLSPGKFRERYTGLRGKWVRDGSTSPDGGRNGGGLTHAGDLGRFDEEAAHAA